MVLLCGRGRESDSASLLYHLSPPTSRVLAAQSIAYDTRVGRALDKPVPAEPDHSL